MAKLPSYPPTKPKVSAATVASSVTVIVLYVLGGVPLFAAMPGEVRGALLVLVTAAATWAAGWLKRDTLLPEDEA